MLGYYKTIDLKIREVSEFERHCWINLTEPTQQELDEISAITGVEKDFLRAPLDEEETSRIESEDGVTLIVIDIPIVSRDEKNLIYSTLPLGIILTPECIITVSANEIQVIKEFCDGLVKNVQTDRKTRFIFQILLRMTGRYLQYLRQIEKMSVYIEKQLHKSLKNKELIQMLDLQKSLVYFSTSLKADEVTLRKLTRGNVIPLYEEDAELLEDVLIEIKQAIEMATIYSDIMTGTMDAFASVISNNLSILMKVLTSITILMTIPNIVFGFYGMNVRDLPLPVAWAPLAISAVLVVVTAVILKKRNLL